MTNIEELPFDCWLTILLYINNVEDYLSISLVIKNLREYIISLDSYAARNIPFKLKVFPTEKKKEVSYIECNSKLESELTYFKKCYRQSESNYSIEKVPVFLDIFRIFPNVVKIKFYITSNTHQSNLINFRTPFVLFDQNFLANNLFFLKLRIENKKKLIVNSTFPNLKNLSVRVFRKFSNYETDRKLRGYLSMDWKKCQSVIKELKMENIALPSNPLIDGFISNFHDLGDRVRKMNLKNVQFPSSLTKSVSFSFFSNLTSLKLENTIFSSIKNLNNLKILSIVFKRSFGGGQCDFKNIENLPSLEILNLRLCFGNQRKNDSFCLKNSPQLREVTLKYFTYSVEIIDSPNIHRISHHDGGSITLSGRTNVENLEIVKCNGESETLLPYLSKLTRLRRVKIIPRTDIKHRTYSIEGLEHLESLICKCITFSSIKKCPKLNELITTLSKRVIISELPSLKKLLLGGFETVDDVDNIEDLTLKYRDEMPISVVNMLTLKKLSWVFPRDCDTSQSIVTVKECERLETLEISSEDYTQNKMLKKFRICPKFNLSNLSSLKTLKFTNFYLPQGDYSFNIQELILCDLFCKIDESKSSSSISVISGKMFPNLKNLEIECCQVKLSSEHSQKIWDCKFYTLEKLENLINLQQIAVNGRKQQISLMKCVVGLDLDSIVMKWLSEEGISTCSLRSYCKNFNVEIIERRKDVEEKKNIKTTTTTTVCERCGKEAEKKCSRCKKVYYCSHECHVKDWKRHKKQCCKQKKKK